MIDCQLLKIFLQYDIIALFKIEYQEWNSLITRLLEFGKITVMCKIILNNPFLEILRTIRCIPTGFIQSPNFKLSYGFHIGTLYSTSLLDIII